MWNHSQVNITKPYYWEVNTGSSHYAQVCWLIEADWRIFASVKHTNIRRLIGTKPLSESMLPYCQLDPDECCVYSGDCVFTVVDKPDIMKFYFQIKVDVEVNQPHKW